MTYEVVLGGRTYKIELEAVAAAPSHASPETRAAATEWKAQIDGRVIHIDCVATAEALSLIIDGKSYEIRIERAEEAFKVFLGGRTYECAVRDPRSLRSRKRGGQAETGEHRLTASMPGKVVRVLVRAGEAIAAGQGILVIEAMKMQNEVRSTRAGSLKILYVKEGTNVNSGQVLAVIE